jgi:phospholipase/carboxylesterase
MTTSTLDLAGLTAHLVVSSPGSPGGSPEATLITVLLHGFGAPGDDLVPLAGELSRAARAEPPASICYVFPEAPLELGGAYGDARAWWLLDLARLEDELRRGVPRDRRDEVPDGLPAARTQVLRLLDQLEARFAAPGTRIVLGGFSQGAMLALDVALHRERPPAGLILMSGTLINQAEWTPRLPSLRGIPVLLSHGRADALLPYAAAETLRDRLREAGADVQWHPFVGGHEIPRVIVAAAGAFLRSLASP